jgi:hypothetical protein
LDADASSALRGTLTLGDAKMLSLGALELPQ